MSFASLGLSEALVSAVNALGYTEPTPVQQRAIPAVLREHDLMVAAQTGTGKTGSFALPILERLFPHGNATPRPRKARQISVLVLTPTRELAAQVHENFRQYADHLPLNSACVFGGVGMNPQIKALMAGLDVLVACPGRLLDLAKQGYVDFSALQILVLDEADRMLDMGFIHDVRKVLAQLPSKRQNLLFSATFSRDITELAGKLLKNPARIEVTPPNSTVERIEQRIFHIPANAKRPLLAHLIRTGDWHQVLVFTRTKHGANRLAEYLDKQGLPAAAIHGNKSQNARTKALANFKSGELRVLVATDIAARGLDIDQLPHVVNFELPNVEEDYVHRIGRTGRAGRAGEAVSLVAPAEDKLLRNIERLTKQKIPLGDLLGFDLNSFEQDHSSTAADSTPRKEGKAPRRNSPQDQNERRHKKPPRQLKDGGDPKANKRTPPPRQKPEKKRNQQTTQGSVKMPENRAPDEFFDDDIDNFGNRIDYVSPYQGKPTGGNARRSNKGSGTKPSSAQPFQAAKRPVTNKVNNNKSRSKPHNKNRNTRGQERQLTPTGPVNNNAMGGSNTLNNQNRPSRKPVIMRKGSKLDRYPNLDQLDKRTGEQNEKPSLLTRNN